jgi:hypothetical protein
MSKPRITCVVTKDDNGDPAEVFFYLNPEGRDLLVKELLHLDERWDHLHIQPEEWTVDLPLQISAYVPDQETVIQHVKMMYRPDAWDEEHFPHVLKDDTGA